MSRNLHKPDPHLGLELTKRDIQIIEALYRFRLLTTDQIQILTGAVSRSKLNDRLRQLWGRDFLDRPDLQKQMYAYAKKRPTVHALGDAGAQWLVNNRGIRFPSSVKWKAKNKSLKSTTFVEHTLGVTDVMLRAEREVNSVEGLRVLDRQEIWASSARFNPKQPKPFELRTKFTWAGEEVRRRTIPDYTFALADTRGERPTRGLLFVEFDNNTEDYVRSSAVQSSILQKFLGYADAYNRKLPELMYGYKRFRVLFVVDANPNRIDNMIAVYQAHVKDILPAGALLFATKKELETKGILAPIWLTGKRNIVSLVNLPDNQKDQAPYNHSDLRQPHSSTSSVS